MKKICSVILSCALLLGLLVVPGAAAEPAVQTLDFETVQAQDIQLTSEEFSIYSKVGSDDNNVHGGEKSLCYAPTEKTAGTGVAALSLIGKLSFVPGKDYILSFWIKSSGTTKTEPTATRVEVIESTSSNPWSAPWDNSVMRALYAINVDSNKNGPWQQVTMKFTAGQGSLKNVGSKTYLCLRMTGLGYGFYLDDLTITEVAPVTVDFKEADGTVIDQRMGLPGSALTLPRTPEKEGYSFDGWYEDADFTTAFTGTTFPTASKSLYAKFKDVSIYDSYTDTAAQYPTSTDGGDTAPTLSAADGILSLTGKSAKEKRNAWISLTPATSEYATTKDQVYRVEFDVKATYNETISGVLGTYGNEWVTSAKNQTAWNTNGAATEWQHLSATITSNGTTLRACVWSLPTGETIQFKNLKITPVTVQTDLEKAVAAELEYQGSSLRPEDAEKKAHPIPGNNGEAAIRFKSKISNKLLNEGITVSKVHYSVVEYGHTYFREDLMGGNTVLDIGTAYTSGKAAKNAVAYRKENGAVTTDIWFSKDETNVTYTAALYNFTEQSYTLTYVARPYVRLVADNSTEEITVYGANTQFAAFNDVADRAFYAHPGDVYNRAAAYTDVNGDSWSESYEIRSALYNTVLSKLSGQGFNYLAPAAAAE